MQTPQLFTILPEYICTPDSMEIDRHGNMVLSCPNYAQVESTGVMVKIDKDRNVTKWFDVPVHPETGVARNMGICFDKDWNLYVCDNQGWSGAPELQEKGRMLKLTVTDGGEIKKCVVMADGMDHPNGVKIRGDYIYVTQSCMPKVKHPSGKLVSAVYRFRLDEENVKITNTLDDKNIFATFITENPDCQYGVDGIEMDKEGNMYIGNFGDGEVWKITFNDDDSLREQYSFAKDPAQLQTTDGFCFDDAGKNMYIADFSANAICVMYPDGRLERIAQSPDCDGLDGGLDQPGEPRVFNGKVVASCFDLVVDATKVNTAHEMPATMSMLDLVD